MSVDVLGGAGKVMFLTALTGALFGAGGYNALSFVCRRWFRRDILVRVVLQRKGTEMGEKGKRDKGGREQKKKAQHTQAEKRKLKREKKNK